MKAELTVELDLGDGNDYDMRYNAFYGLINAAYALMHMSEDKVLEDIGNWDVRVDNKVIGSARLRFE